jgi:hypothetical protein
MELYFFGCGFQRNQSSRIQEAYRQVAFFLKKRPHSTPIATGYLLWFRSKFRGGFSMSESFFESSVEETQADLQLAEEEPEPKTLSLNADDFSALEQRIVRAVELVRKERLARAEAEERAAQAELQLREQAPLVQSLQKEVVGLRSERDYVRQRVERLLAQFDALEV